MAEATEGLREAATAVVPGAAWVEERGVGTEAVGRAGARGEATGAEAKGVAATARGRSEEGMERGVAGEGPGVEEGGKVAPAEGMPVGGTPRRMFQ